MDNTDHVLDFAAHLGRQMLGCGANLERVTYSLELICKRYNLVDVSIVALSTSISISARETIGYEPRFRQVTVPGNGIHLERLRRLNDLSFRVCRDRPEPDKLMDMLFETMLVPSYSVWTLLTGYLIAMISLCLIFGGGIREVLIVCINTVILYKLTQILSREQINHIVSNAVCMFIAGSITLLFTSLGFIKDHYAVIITNAFYLIPGVPMINAVRNLLCGNEMNGLVELFKVILETASIVAGLFIAYFLFGHGMRLF